MGSSAGLIRKVVIIGGSVGTAGREVQIDGDTDLGVVGLVNGDVEFKGESEGKMMKHAVTKRKLDYDPFASESVSHSFAPF